jgi:hypothetical protein
MIRQFVLSRASTISQSCRICCTATEEFMAHTHCNRGSERSELLGTLRSHCLRFARRREASLPVCEARSNGIDLRGISYRLQTGGVATPEAWLPTLYYSKSNAPDTSNAPPTMLCQPISQHASCNSYPPSTTTPTIMVNNGLPNNHRSDNL